MLLQDKVIIVTGAGSGIGRATAILAAQAGARVVLSGTRRDALDGVADEIGTGGNDTMVVQADVGVESDVADLVAKTVERFGRLDGAFNNAGVPMHNKPIDELTADEWDGVQRVNARGVFLCMKYEIAAMRARQGGAIVNDSSIDGVLALPHWAEYTSSKHAVVGLTRAASAEAGETRVRVNAVLPGYIVTPMSERLLSDTAMKHENDLALSRHSVGRFGTPEDVGYAVRWLLSDEAAFVNGALLPVDGGFTAR